MERGCQQATSVPHVSVPHGSGWQDGGHLVRAVSDSKKPAEQSWKAFRRNHVWVCVGLSDAGRGSGSSESRDVKEILLVPWDLYLLFSQAMTALD